MPTDWKRVAAEAWDHPGWKDAAIEYHRLRDGRASVVESAKVDDWLAKKQKERHRRLVQLERILLAIAIHGPGVIEESENAKVKRWMRDNWQEGYWQIRAAEREEYWRRQAEAMRPPAHDPGCACWECVLRLHGEAARHQAELAVRARGKEPW